MRSSKTKRRGRSPARRRSCSAAATDRASRTVGILGGIFDPVHNGHLAVAACAARHFRLSKILFVPSGRPPHKEHVGASAADRLAMLCLALRDEPLFSVWDGELRRKGLSYTIDTVDALSAEFPDCQFYFLVGSDNLCEIAAWRRFREVLSRVVLCVTRRPGYPVTVPALLRVGRVENFPSPALDISSTGVRERIAEGRPFRRLVPRDVAEYISIRKLYSR